MSLLEVHNWWSPVCVHGYGGISSFHGACLEICFVAYGNLLCSSLSRVAAAALMLLASAEDERELLGGRHDGVTIEELGPQSLFPAALLASRL